MNDFKGILIIIFFLLIGIASNAQTSETLPNNDTTTITVDINTTQPAQTTIVNQTETTQETTIETETNEAIAFSFNYKQAMKPVLRKSAYC